MYVVRTDDTGESEYKVFSTLPGARHYFTQELLEVYEGAYQRVALYGVPDEIRDPIEAVRSADPRVWPVEIEESETTRMDRIVRDIAPKLKINI